jgi:hypothetical protein
MLNALPKPETMATIQPQKSPGSFAHCAAGLPAVFERAFPQQWLAILPIPSEQDVPSQKWPENEIGLQGI